MILSNEEIRKLEATRNTIMLGVLAPEGLSYYDSTLIEDDPAPITISDRIDKFNDYIGIVLKPISDEPSEIRKINNETFTFENFYIAYDKWIDYTSVGLSNSMRHHTSIEKRIEIFRDKLKNKIVVFKPKLSIKEKSKRDFRIDKEYNIFKNYDIVKIVDLPEALDVYGFDDVNYKQVPVVNYKQDFFEDKIRNSEYVQFNEYSEFLASPEFVLCGNRIYYELYKWEQHEEKAKHWKPILSKDGWAAVDIPDEYLYNNEYFVQINDGLVFVNYDKSHDLFESIREKSIEKNKDIQLKDEICDDKKKAVTDIVEENIEISASEAQFIDGLKSYTMFKGLSYTDEDLVNFHVCVKTNLLTILAGMTGTGKSELARAYAQMLDLDEQNEKMLFLPISPNYTEPSDILGYMNTSVGIYNPAESGLLDYLLKASKSPDKMHLVIFDEMNLSQVEHWFAQFISILEVEEENRYLTLYSSNMKCLNGAIYPPRIKIGNNIRFIGTMNLDETTRDISDRMLDRANVITLKKRSFIDHKVNMDNFNMSEPESYKLKVCESFSMYDSWISKEDELREFESNHLEFFDELHETIIKYDTQKGVSFRVLKRIGDYINNIPKFSDNSLGLLGIEKEKAIDLQVKQRIISKLKGTEKQFGKLIGSYDHELERIYDSKLLNLLDSEKAKAIGEFTETKNLLMNKAKELTLYGYTN